MIKVSELTGAQLDYWVARAEGSADAMIVQWPSEQVCLTSHHALAAMPFRPSTQWAQGGPLIEKYELCIGESRGWFAGEIALGEFYTGRATGEGDTPLQAICRAVVRAAFGDEVEEVSGCP